jgi:hypothetical protein
MERDVENLRPSEVLLARLRRVLELADPAPPGFGRPPALTGSARLDYGRGWQGGSDKA